MLGIRASPGFAAPDGVQFFCPEKLCDFAALAKTIHPWVGGI